MKFVTNAVQTAFLDIKMVLFRVLMTFILWLAEQIVKRTDSKIDDQILDFLKNPLQKIIKRGKF